MVRVAGFVCSSSKNRDLPLRGAFWRAVAACVEKAAAVVIGGQKGCDITWGYVA
jgi:hypothetical protein